MSELLGLLFSTIPLMGAFFAAAVFVLYALIGLSHPRFLLYPYFGILFLLSATTYGRLDAVSTSIYSRGAGVLYFSFLLWCLLGAMLWAYVSARFQRKYPQPCNLLPWFFGFVALLVGHVLVGLSLEVSFEEAVSPAGISNIAWMGVMILAVQLAFRERAELKEFLNIIILVGLGKAIFGLIRWGAFGGDPANAYENRHKLDLKLTYFDINDNLICWVALVIAALGILSPNHSSRIWRSILWLTVISCAVCIVLSFRRTAWLGLIFGGIFLLYQIPLRRRVQTAIFSAPFLLAGITYSAWKRLSQTRGAGGLEGFFFDIQAKAVGQESHRLLELKLVIAEFLDNPLFGVGSWGRFRGHELISWQTGDAAGTFVHSGILHIAYKTGLIGIVLAFGIGYAFVSFWKKKNEFIDIDVRPLAVAGVSGALFMVPDFVIGSPVPQVRTMQMLALVLSFPYVAYSVSTRKLHNKKLVRGSGVVAPEGAFQPHGFRHLG